MSSGTAARASSCLTTSLRPTDACWVPKAKQEEALQWLLNNAFSSPTWLVNTTALQNTAYSGYTEKLRATQVRYLNRLLSFETLGRLTNGTILNAENYKPLSFLSQLRKGIWQEATKQQNVSVYRRNLQKAYVERMQFLMTEKLTNFQSNDFYLTSQSDIPAMVRGELKQLLSQLKLAKNGAVNLETKYHYDDCIARIDEILNPKK